MRRFHDSRQAQRNPWSAWVSAPSQLFSSPAKLFIACWIGALAYQFFAGAYQDEFFYEDSAPHFVTGVMVADYFRTNLGSDPVAFAENYYIRSPKVGFGRWPPLFHLLQGAFYLGFGASKTTALVLVAAISAAVCTCLSSRMYRLYGWQTSVLALLLFVSFRAVREQTLLVMSDLLTVLFCMLAVFAFADFIGSRRSYHLALAGMWSLLAMLTKETSAHLLLLLSACGIFAAGKNFRRDWRPGVFGLLILVAGGGLLAVRLFSGTGIHGFQNLTQLYADLPNWEQIRAKLATIDSIAPVLVIFLAGCGYLCSIGFRTTPEARLNARLCVAWLGAIVVVYLVSPAQIGRYLMPALIPLTMLVGSLFDAMRKSMSDNPRIAPSLLPAIIVVAVALTAPPMPSRGIRGYATVAQSIPIQPGLVTLISSSSFGEGAFISERLLADRRQAGIVLRGSKVLANSDWNNTNYQLLKKSSAEVYAYLCEVPVQYVVIDKLLVLSSELSPDRDLVQRAMEEHPADFRPIGHYPVFKDGTAYDDALIVYENVSAKGRPPEALRVERDNHTGEVVRIQNIRERNVSN